MSQAPVNAGAAPAARGRLVRALQVLLGLSCGLGLAEAVFWLRDGGAFPHLNIYVADPRLGVRLRPGATQRIAFTGNPRTRVRINRDGYRGADLLPPAAPAPQGSDEVLVVGDSQVFGLGVEEQETFSAQLQELLGGKAVVVNAGVPTYGPPEYEAVIEEMLKRRHPRTVVYVANFANDLFEATRKNPERHVVWDGWAVRKETAPKDVLSFPGRALLFQQSHAVFALRAFLYRRGPRLDDRGFASEGTWKDVAKNAGDAGKEHEQAAQKEARSTSQHQQEIAAVTTKLAEANRKIDELIFSGLTDPATNPDASPDPEIAQALEPAPAASAIADVQQARQATAPYNVARGSPGDIVADLGSESVRRIVVTANFIRESASGQKMLEERLRKQAAADPKSQRSQDFLGLLAERDALLARAAVLRGAAPGPPAPVWSPLLPSVKRARALCDASQARLVVVALPIDVQVSRSEWKKYGADPIDMEPSRVLLQDLVRSAENLGVSALDATFALLAAEPGAFLDGDIHMTRKGHRALAEALYKKLQEPPPVPLPGSGLPPGRSVIPAPSEWWGTPGPKVTGQKPGECELALVREWLQVSCSRRGKSGPTGVRVVQGGAGEALAVAAEDGVSVAAPVLPEADLVVDFTWADKTRRLVAHWQEGEAAPSLTFSPPGPPGAAADIGEGAARLCTCQKKLGWQKFCKFVSPRGSLAEGRCNRADLTDTRCLGLYGAPTRECLETYPNNCQKLLECAHGEPDSRPRCHEGWVNAGGTGQCFQLCGSARPCAQGTCTPWQGSFLCK